MMATFAAGVRVEDVERWLEEHGPWLAGNAAVPAGGRPSPADPVGASRLVAKARARPRARALLDAVSGRASRLERGFRIGLALEAAGVRAARPLALLESRSGLARRAVLVLERVEGVHLREFLLSRRDPPRALWSALASAIAGLHAAGVRQRDLKAPNIIIREDGEGAIQTTFIDLDGMDVTGTPPPLRVRVRDLARLAASLREDALRARGIGEADWSALVAAYLEAYAGREPGAAEVSSIVARTVAWAERKAARNRRRGRVVE
jgi:tRNA A-37 threonylcarbamoyl transferase component Bud32